MWQRRLGIALIVLFGSHYATALAFLCSEKLARCLETSVGPAIFGFFVLVFGMPFIGIPVLCLIVASMSYYIKYGEWGYLVWFVFMCFISSVLSILQFGAVMSV